ncbi:MAG: molybdopterin molybdenumtransferase MoeA, partial [Chloroflexota bacterium]
MSGDRLLSVEEARAAVFAAIAGATPTEVAPLADTLGRVAAELVRSPMDLPPWDNSAMDGYAIRATDTTTATEDTPVRLAVTGEVRAGQAPDAI